MAKRLGREYSVGVGIEGSAVRGIPADPQFWIPLSEAPGIENRVTLIEDKQGYGVIEDSVDVQDANKWADGSITGRVRIKSIGLFLLNIFGTCNTTPNSPVGYNTHVFTVQQGNQHPSFTVGIADPQAGDIGHPLGMIEKLEIKAELEEPIVFTADLVAKQSESFAVTPAFPTTPELIFTAKDMKAYFAATAAALSDDSPTNVKSATIRFLTPLEKDFILGSEDPNDINNTIFGIEIEITKSYIDTTFKGYFLGATGRAMRLRIASGATEKLQITLNQVKLMDWSKTPDLDGLMTETLLFRAHFKLADSKMAQATLINTQTSYVEGIGGSQLSARAKIAAA